MLRFNTLLRKLILKMLFRSSGESIFDRGWNNLIILDACRYDVLADMIKGLRIEEGVLKEHISLGSDTTEFLLKNFIKDYYDDTIYVTANPYVNIILKNKVFKIVPVWLHGWDTKLGTVHPVQVYYYALKTYLEHPDKRLIVHFIQPHYPYINYLYNPMKEALESLRSEAKSGSPRSDFSLPLRWRRLVKVLRERKIYHARFYIELDERVHKSAYKDNLRVVLPYALRLAKLLPGTNVITSDHGEAFGEKLHPLIPIKVYGHLPEIHIPALVKVPWYVIKNKSTKEEATRVVKEELKVMQREILRLRITKAMERMKVVHAEGA